MFYQYNEKGDFPMVKKRDNKRRVLRRLRMIEQMERLEKSLLLDFNEMIVSGYLDLEKIKLKLGNVLAEKEKLVDFINDTIKVVEDGKL